MAYTNYRSLLRYIILSITIIALIWWLFLFILTPPLYPESLSLNRIKQKCISWCEDIRQENSSIDQLEKAFDYCSSYHFAKPLEDNLPSSVTYCHCFEIPGIECSFNNITLDPKGCLQVFCKMLQDHNYTKEEAEDKISRIMSYGNCTYITKRQARDSNQNWYNKYFQDPNCTRIFSEESFHR